METSPSPLTISYLSSFIPELNVLRRQTKLAQRQEYCSLMVSEALPYLFLLCDCHLYTDSGIKTWAANHPLGTALAEEKRGLPQPPDIKHELHRPCAKRGMFKKSCLLVLLCYSSGNMVRRGTRIDDNPSICKGHLRRKLHSLPVCILLLSGLLFSKYSVSPLPLRGGRKLPHSTDDGFSHVT